MPTAIKRFQCLVRNDCDAVHVEGIDRQHAEKGFLPADDALIERVLDEAALLPRVCFGSILEPKRTDDARKEGYSDDSRIVHR